MSVVLKSELCAYGVMELFGTSHLKSNHFEISLEKGGEGDVL